jgi:signal transduction histidine kinase/GAF domain-containing protein
LERNRTSSEKPSLHKPPEGQGRNLTISQSPLKLVLSIALSIFVYEAILMLLFSFFPSLSRWLKSLLDSTLLVVLLSPTLYFFLFHPLSQHKRERQRAEERLKKAQEELEMRVCERTAELAEKNEELKREIQKRWQAEETIKQEFRVNAALSELYAPLISPSSSIESITKVILDRAKALTGSEHGYVSSIDPITGDAVGHTLTEMLKDQCRLLEEKKKVVFPRGEDGLYPGLWGHALNTGEAFFTNSPATHEASEIIPEGHVPIRRFLSVPVLLGEEIVGQIALANKGEDYTEQNLEAIRRVAEFYALAIQRKRAQEALQKRELDLGERVKELNCLYGISHLIEKPNISFQEILQGTIDLIPPSWQYPEITCARLILMDQVFTSKKFRETAWKQAREIVVYGEQIGSLEVFYLEQRPKSDEGPFLKEERSLINSIAARLGRIVERIQAKEALQNAHDKLESRVEERTVELAKANARLRAEVEERIRIQEQIEQSRETLQGIFDGISDPLILMDAQMKVKMVNRAAADYYGITKPQDLHAGTCHQLLKESLTPCEGCEVPQAISNRKNAMFEREGLMDADRIEHVFIYPLEGGDAQGPDVLLRISDITEQRLFEEQLIQSEKLASLGTLVSSIAHEINNPNSFITLNIPILRDFLETLIPIADKYAERHPDLELCHMPYPEFRKDILALLDNIQHGSDRIYRVVSNLREFSQVKGKKEEKWVDLKSVIDKSLSLCGVKVRSAVKTFVTDIPEDLPKVYTDPYSLEQIIVNLLANAADASDKRDSWIKLRVAVNETWLDHTIIEVSDNGHGMDEEARHKIFDPFVTSKSRSDGTGLGLYVCYNLAEALRGRIDVESEPGMGSTFRVILPDKERRLKRRV